MSPIINSDAKKFSILNHFRLKLWQNVFLRCEEVEDVECLVCFLLSGSLGECSFSSVCAVWRVIDYFSCHCGGNSPEWRRALSLFQQVKQ